MNIDIVMDVLRRKINLESALENFLCDIKENWDKNRYYHFIVDDNKISFYSDYNKEISDNGIEIITGKWFNDFRKRTKESDMESFKNNLIEIFYCDVNYINLLKRKVNELLEVL